MKTYICAMLMVAFFINNAISAECTVIDPASSDIEYSAPAGCSGITRVIICPDATYYDCPSCVGGIASIYSYQTNTVVISPNESYSYGTCSRDTVVAVKCLAGYFGNGATCTKCSTATGDDSATSAAGSIVITSCYIPSGNSFSDSSGSGVYTGNCYYSE